MSANDNGPDAQEQVDTIISEEGAESTNGWDRITIRPEQTDEMRGDALAQWANVDESMFVTFYIDRPSPGADRDDPRFNAWLTSTDDAPGTPKTSITSFSKNLENALDRTINWLQSHDPFRPIAEFQMRIEGGKIVPIIDALRRFTGRGLIEARPDEVVLRGHAFNSTVEATIPATAMESYDLTTEGELAFDPDDAWEMVRDFNFSETIPLRSGFRDGRPALFIGDGSRFQENPVTFPRSAPPDPFPFDAQLEVGGLEYRDVLRSVGAVAEDEVAFGVFEDVPILIGEQRVNLGTDDNPDFETEVVRARFDAVSSAGAGVVAIDFGRLDELRKAVPRPSQTSLRFTLKEDIPLMVEYDVDSTDVTARIALSDPDTIADFTLEVPPEEITVPEPSEEEETAEEVAEVTVVSLNRPLTRQARRDLQDFGIIDTRDVNEPPRWTEVDLAERPPDELLERHELRVVEDPVEIWESPQGTRLEIFRDRVISEGLEAAMSPEEAAEEARKQGFTPIDVPEDSPLIEEEEPDVSAPQELTPGQVETIVENATINTIVQTFTMGMPVGENIREIRIDDATTRDRIATPQRNQDDPLRPFIREAIETWESRADLSEFSAEQIEKVNTNRRALEEQFGIKLPELTAPDPDPKEREAEPEAPAPTDATAAGLTATELADRINQMVVAATVRVDINPDADSLRITFQIPTTLPPDIRGVEVDLDLDGEVISGVPGNPVPAINEALAAWENAVDIRTVPDEERETISEARERFAEELADRLNRAVEIRDVGAAPTDRGEAVTEEMEFTPQSDILQQDELPTTLFDDELWQQVDEIINRSAGKKEEKEGAIQKLLHEPLEQDFPGVFDRPFVDIIFSRRGSNVTALQIGGPLTTDASIRFAGGTVFREIMSQRPLDGEPPQSAYLALAELLEILETDNRRFNNLQDWLELLEVSGIDTLEQANVNLNDLFIDRDSLRPLVVRGSRRMWLTALNGAMQNISAAYQAAQRVHECQQAMGSRDVADPAMLASVDPICNFVEDIADATAIAGSTPWYFNEAWQQLREGDFDAVEFVIDYHGVDIPSNIGEGALTTVYNRDGTPKAQPAGADQVQETEREEEPTELETVEEAADIEEETDPFSVEGKTEFFIFLEDGGSPAIGISPSDDLQPRQLEGRGIADEVALAVRDRINVLTAPSEGVIGVATVNEEGVQSISLSEEVGGMGIGDIRENMHERFGG